MFSHQEVLVVLDASHTLKGFSFAQSFPFHTCGCWRSCSLTCQKDVCLTLTSTPLLSYVWWNPLTQFISCWCFRIHGNCLQILGCAMKSRVCKIERLQKPWHFLCIWVNDITLTWLFKKTFKNAIHTVDTILTCLYFFSGCKMKLDLN